MAGLILFLYLIHCHGAGLRDYLKCIFFEMIFSTHYSLFTRGRYLLRNALITHLIAGGQTFLIFMGEHYRFRFGEIMHT